MTSDIYTDQFIVTAEFSFGIDQEFDVVRFGIDPGGQDVVDSDPDNDIAIRSRQINQTLIGNGTPDDIYRETYRLEYEDGTIAEVAGITIQLRDKDDGSLSIAFTPTDGTIFPQGKVKFISDALSSTGVVGDVTFQELGPTCFVSGTLIQTPDGLRPVEDLNEGDFVTGYGGQELTLRKVLRQQFSARALRANPKLQPVRIMAGALGNHLPVRDLLVSRQHRMLVSSKISGRMFGQLEVLISAIRLTKLPDIFVDKGESGVEYFHLLFDKHEVIFAEGAPTESLLIGPNALKSLSAEIQEEVLTIFPETADFEYSPNPARIIPRGRKQKKLINRHIRNPAPLA